jgi:hypothetical protein
MRFVVLFASIVGLGLLSACGDDAQVGAGGASGGGGLDEPLTTTGSAPTSSGSTSSSTGPTSAGPGGSSVVSSSGAMSSSGVGAGFPEGHGNVMLIGDGTSANFEDVALLSSGDYVVAGWGPGYGVLARVTPDGEVVWSRRVGPGDTSLFSDVMVLEDDSVVVGGYVRIETARMIVARVSADGDVVWQRQAPTGLGLDDDVGAIARHGDVLDLTVGNGVFVSITTDGAYVSGAKLAPEPFDANALSLPDVEGTFLSGSVYVDEDDNTRKSWVARLDADGEIAWQRTIEVDDDVGHIGAPMPDGGFVLAHHDRDFDRVTVTLLDAEGTWLWSRAITRPDGDLWFDDIATSWTEIVLAGYVMTDEAEDEASLAALRFNTQGDLEPSLDLGSAEMTLGSGVEILDGFGVVVGFGVAGGVVLFGDGTVDRECGDWASPAFAPFDMAYVEVDVADGDVELSASDVALGELDFLAAVDLGSSVVCTAP